MTKAICVGVGLKSEPVSKIKENLMELVELVVANDCEVVGSITQILSQYNPTFLIGTGKVEEIKKMIQDLGANLVVIDHQLSGGQTRNLEKELQVKVLDRSQIILEIFSKRAKTFEGKLQVELAQLMDQLPRMVGAWMDSLSRQGGGIGTRGPGETALEQDKRRIRERIQLIRKKLEVVRKNRAQNREMRKQSEIVSFALIGYTNSGKSSLLQRLTGKTAFIKNQPFATLDPMTRKIFLGPGFQAVVTDTVGFIRKIPPQLIEAFKATLEESEESDFLIHVIDLSHPQRDQHIEVVEKIMEELKWDHKKVIYVYNKVDIAPIEARFQVKGYPRVFVSALTGEGIDTLKELMKEMITNKTVEMEFFFALHQQQDFFNFTRDADLISQNSGPTGTHVKARIKKDLIGRWSQFSIQK
ncbi:MAG: GTPase HflX [Bdellovibrionaceae bacterium]|nr:GTPase HflX [Pseudobdellovibrionaceae bacterium]